MGGFPTAGHGPPGPEGLQPHVRLRFFVWSLQEAEESIFLFPEGGAPVVLPFPFPSSVVLCNLKSRALPVAERGELAGQVQTQMAPQDLPGPHGISWG